MTKNQIKLLLEKLSERPIAFHPVYARVFGGINAAILIQQLHFWGDKGSREDGYIYKTKKCIQDETTLTERQQDIARRILEKTGVLNTKVLKVNGSPTVHYKVSDENLFRRIIEHYKMSETSITENTTESTKKVPSSPEGEKANSLGRGNAKRRDERILRILEKFNILCIKYFKKESFTGIAEYSRLKQLLNKGMTEKQLCDHLDYWFNLGKSIEETFSLRKALSDNQINTYRILYMRN